MFKTDAYIEVYISYDAAPALTS